MASVARRSVIRVSTRARARIERAFAAVQMEARKPETQLTAPEKSREAEIRQLVGDVTVDNVVQWISSLNIDISRTLSGLSAQLQAEVGRLGILREAVEIEQRELGRLYKVEVVGKALDVLVQDYAQKQRELDEELNARRAVWEEQSRASEREAARREAALIEREQESIRLRAELDRQRTAIQDAAERAAAEATLETEGRLGQQVLDLQKEKESDRRFAELRIRTLEETSARQAAQIASLENEVAEAKRRMQEITLKAIESVAAANTAAVAVGSEPR